tara:strand:- start:363 stop:842 length:480 start_codon:yes stop_codon:yes gene_type:complete
MEHIVDLLELGALAQMVGAIAIIISLFLVLVELRKNLQQHLLSNTLARSIEVEKMHYQQMDESMANLIVKGRKSYNHLDENEKIRLESYLLQKLAIYSRGYTIASASAYGQPTQHLKDRIKTNAQEFLSYEGIKECYKDLRERDLINEDYFVNEIELSV